MAPESPTGDVYGAFATGDEDTEVLDTPAEAAQCIRAITNETKILKGASFVVQPNVARMPMHMHSAEGWLARYKKARCLATAITGELRLKASAA